MKKIRIKDIAMTTLICVATMLLGISAYDELTNKFIGYANSLKTRDFIIFGVPFLIAFVQVFYCVLIDYFVKSHGSHSKKKNLKQLLPFFAAIGYIATIAILVGKELELRKIIMFSVAMLFIFIGAFFTQTRRINLAKLKLKPVRTRQQHKFNKFVGYELIILAIIFLASMFLDKSFSIVAAWAVLPALIIAVAVARTLKPGSKASALRMERDY